MSAQQATGTVCNSFACMCAGETVCARSSSAVVWSFALWFSFSCVCSTMAAAKAQAAAQPSLQHIGGSTGRSCSEGCRGWVWLWIVLPWACLSVFACCTQPSKRMQLYFCYGCVTARWQFGPHICAVHISKHPAGSGVPHPLLTAWLTGTFLVCSAAQRVAVAPACGVDCARCRGVPASQWPQNCPYGWCTDCVLQ